jgi:hypothetical protein
MMNNSSSDISIQSDKEAGQSSQQASLEKLRVYLAAFRALAGKNRIDVLVLVVVAIGFGVFIYWLEQGFNPVIYSDVTADAWFDSDVHRVFNNLTDRNSDHYRTNVHPLFSLLTYPVVQFIIFISGMDEVTAVRLFVAGAAGLWMAFVYLLLRSVTGRRLDGLLFSLVCGVSAAAFFWLTVPETYVFGSTTIIIALLFAVWAERRRPSREWPAIVTSAITLSMLVTNWMAGVIVTAVHFPWKRAVQITINALVIVVFLWGIQKYFFPSTLFFLDVFEEDSQFLLPERSGGPVSVTRSFFLHTLSMPEPEIIGRHMVVPPYPNLMLTQPSAAGSGSIWGAVAIMLWVGLLGFGILGMLRAARFPRLRIIILALLIGQFLLYIFYGAETFLYSLIILPVLIMVAAMGSFARERLVVLVMAGLLVITAGINNYNQFQQAAAFFDNPVVVIEAQTGSLPLAGEENPSGRERVLAAMRERPNDPWPRGRGHVVLAIPGSPEIDKGYLEPGGSFSPAVGSFGLSFWVYDEDGRLLTTSDDILLPAISQRLIWMEGGDWPGIQTETPYYQAIWQPLSPGEWQLDVTPASDVSGQLALMVRSVGPAGGPVNSLVWQDGLLKVNENWEIDTAVELPVLVGHEGDNGWLDLAGDTHSWQGDDGWGYARFLLPAGESSRVTISTAQVDFVAGVELRQTSARLDLILPDDNFIASLDAQAAHLMMSLVGSETRPGDPVNYPLTWQRDAAYIIVALTRAGELEQARELSGYLAENDFFGGFGAEADGPGLAIWALSELAATMNDRAYEARLWPHIARKAELIEQMLATNEPLYQPFNGPVVPQLVGSAEASLVADPARDGLIIGRMDHHRPLLYVNAVSYQGLVDAAEFAERLGHVEEAARWQTAAANLRQAWQRAFQKPGVENDRTYISSLWPTRIASPELISAYTDKLEQRWQFNRTPGGGYYNRPLWTYFEVGEAHQWLYLERPDRVWDTLNWFWQNQTAPGLYTWWEGAAEENTFHQWEKVRGWVDPPYVTPHYWTTAEMLLLQLDMLVYTRPDSSIVIGGGVPESWLESDLHIGLLHTPGGSVEWQWDGSGLLVTLEGDPVPVTPGPAFADKPIQIQN